MPDKYLVSNAPFLRSVDFKQTTSTIMRDLLIGLSPVILFSIYKNVILVAIKTNAPFIQVIYPLLCLIVAPLFSLVLEAISLYIMKRSSIKSFSDLWSEVKNGFGLFPGLFIALCSPVYINMWVLLSSVAVGEIVGKMLFGGFGQNIFNPALVGRAFMSFCFASVMGTNTIGGVEITNTYFNAYEASMVSTIGSATPLTLYSELKLSGFNDVISKYSILDAFLGFIPGTIGETSALACIIGFIYLTVRKVIDWKVPVVYVGFVFIITLIIGLISGSGFSYALFQVCAGGLMFGAIYMATEPVTSPKTDLGRIMNAAMLGVLTVLFRLVGNLPEGVATSIVTMNIFGLLINKYAVHVRVDGKLTKDELPCLIIYLVILVGLAIYDIAMVLSM